MEDRVGVFVSSKRAQVDGMPQPVIVGYTRRVAGPDEPMHQRIHDEHLFGLLLQGQGTYQLGPDTLPLGEPLAWFLPCGEPDRRRLQGSIEGWWIGFKWPGAAIKPSGGDVLVRAHHLKYTTPRWKRPDPQAILRIVEMFRALLAGAATPDLAGQMRTRGLLLQLLGTYLEQPQEASAPNSHWALEEFTHLLEKRACENVSIEELAAQVQMSSDHLRALFHQRFGRSPLEFRIELRLAMARELLCSSNLYIKEVAHRVGYADPLYFSRAFRRHFGISPREVIRRFRHTVVKP
ncbi:MAG: AraC family transcriptional regulator [Phycisphaeraceae bacterium]